jgi:hypothetical protein
VNEATLVTLALAGVAGLGMLIMHLLLRAPADNP